ncbi:MAG: 4Fe-4S dicluster domain-containing protein [Desulfobacterales bacterium]|nr:4Fe-4S dicluster domain-containing protein [Desulfobacterales bacterium]
MNYPKEREKANGNEKISRRRFLKVTGTIIFVVGAGSYVPAKKSYSKPVTTDAHRDAIPPSNGYLLVDIRKCQGCTSCMLACTLVHEGVENPSLSRIQIIQNPFKSFPDDVTIEQCRQCVDPVCVQACPADALQANAKYGNVRMVDRTKCIGCGDCTEACPYTPSRTVVALDENFNEDFKARKCDLCANTPYHWDVAGGGPDGKQACVEVCPVGAIEFTKEIPAQKGDEGYKVNLRGTPWWGLGYTKG